MRIKVIYDDGVTVAFLKNSEGDTNFRNDSMKYVRCGSNRRARAEAFLYKKLRKKKVVRLTPLSIKREGHASFGTQGFSTFDNEEGLGELGDHYCVMNIIHCP